MKMKTSLAVFPSEAAPIVSRAGFLAVILLAFPIFAVADNSTWLLNPISGDWNTGANWSTGTVPGDMATFDVSNVTNVSVSAFTPILQIVFDSSASPFTITVLPNQLLEFAAIAQGITNTSSVAQNFVMAVDNSGQAGNCAFFYGTVSGQVLFTTEASIMPGGLPGAVYFELSSSSGDGTFHNLGGAVSGGVGGRTDFVESGSTDASTISNDGATVAGGIGGGSSFSQGRPSADNATLIANGGTNGGGGGFFLFADGSLGGTARLEVFGNGYMDMSAHTGPSFSIGSIEGDGPIYLGKTAFMVGSNNLSTAFSGVLHPGSPTGGGGTGSLTKIGTGTLTLSGANLYTAGTTVTAGTLVVSNTTGSATGTGAVQLNVGTLGGSGIISGAVTIGAGGGTGAFLAPAHGTQKQGTLTIQSGLTLNADATYTYTFKAKRNKARTDKVVANGVTINGASFAFQGTAQGTLKQGLTFTAISNTAATPISGTFANLADGAILTVNGNNFQASYEGGDGNDLTLTVVP